MKAFLLSALVIAFPFGVRAVDTTYVTGSSQKLEQFIGNTDLQTGQPTLSLTQQYGLNNTDLGVSFYHQGKTYVLFGDSNFPGTADAIAYTTDTNPETGLKLNFVVDSNIHFLPPNIPGISHSAFDVPIYGISSNGKMYMYYSTDGSSSGPTMGRTVLGSSTDNGTTWSSVIYTLSSTLFINVAVIKVNCADWPGLPQSSGMGLLIFGSGPYRQSAVYLAFQPEASIEDHSALRYMSGLDANNNPTWSTVESDSAVIVAGTTIGELSAAYNVYLKKWLVFFNSGGAIRFVSANKPWGPYSARSTSYDPTADNGYNNYIYLSGGTNNSLCDPNVTGHNLSNSGGVYGPYIFTNFTLGSASETSITTTMYHSMSTWNPYNSILMRTQLTRHIAPVIYAGSRGTGSVSTATSGGADAYVQAGTNANVNFGNGVTLLCKTDAPSVDNVTRKAWMRFPLNLPANQQITSAALTFTTAIVGNSPILFTYNVYGLRPGNAGANWGESTITWNNAPGNDTAEISGTDPLQTSFLGSFTTPANRVLGTQSTFSSLALRDFLNQFLGSAVTLIVSRVTQDSNAESFGSRENGTYAPPTLSYTAVPLIADQTMTKNTTGGAVPFNVDSTVTASTNLTVTATSSDTALIPSANVVLNGTATARTFTITPATDQTGTSAITLKVTDGTSSDSATFNVTVLSFVDSWRLTKFGTASNSGDAADGADPDADGIPNLAEYFLNLDPKVPNSGANLPSIALANGGANLLLSYTRLKAALSEVAYSVEWSDNLATWNTTGVSEQILTDDGTLQQVQATIPTSGATKRFVHLRLTH